MDNTHPIVIMFLNIRKWLAKAFLQDNALLSSLLSSLALVTSLFVLFGKTLFWWSSSGPSLLSSPIRGVAIATAFFFLSMTWGILKKVPFLKCFPSVSGVAWAIPIVFFSDWMNRGYSFLPGPYIRGEILLGALLGGIILFTRSLWLIRWLFPIACLILFTSLLLHADGARIFSDDHSVFFYRLSLLKKYFPFIPFYNPLWNGGIDARDFFASGSLNIFVLFSPLIYLTDLARSYNVLISALLFIVTPASAYFASRIVRMDKIGASFAGLLAMSTGLVWFRWGLKYGTLGFITSAALLPLVLSLFVRAFHKDERFEKREMLALVFFCSLVVCWTLSGLVLLPCLFLGAVSFRVFLKKKWVLIAGVLLLIINLPWMGVFWSVSKVGSFVQAEQQKGDASKVENSFRHKSDGLNLKKSLTAVRSTAIATHPLLLFLGAVGIFTLKRGRGVYGMTALALFLAGSIAVPLKPQLELDRMLVVLFLILSIPTASALQHLIESAKTHSTGLPLQIPILFSFGFLFAGLLSVVNVIHGKSLEQYFLESPAVQRIPTLLQEQHVTGRVVFSGFVLHELSGGHLAPLVLSTNTPLLASSFVHNLWQYRQIFPEEYISAGDSGIARYLDLYNVSHVFAHEPQWRNYFKERPDKYRLTGNAGPFQLFERIGFVEDYFLEGKGHQVNQGLSRIEFIPDTEEVTLKFNYFPFLQSSQCTLLPQSVSPSVTFIRLTGCRIGEPVVLQSRNTWWRLLHG